MSTNVNTLDIPKEIVNALGAETAAVFEKWLDKKIATHAQTVPHVSATAARRKVGLFMLEHVAGQLMATEPHLVHYEGKRPTWRVPVVLAYPNYGTIGEVSEIHVDAKSGMLDYDDKQIEAIKKKALALAEIVLADEPEADSGE